MSPSPDLDALLVAARSLDPDERHDAVGDLVDYDGPDVGKAASAVRAATLDEDQDVAGLAIVGLADRGWPGAREAIERHLRDRSQRKRFAALRAAGVIDIGDRADAAWDALGAREWATRVAAAGALTAARVPSALDPIRRLAALARRRRQPAAEAHLLGSAMLLGDAESARRFRSLLVGSSREARGAAAYFLDRGPRLHQAARIIGAGDLRSDLEVGMERENAVRQRHPGLWRGRYPTIAARLLDRLGDG